MWQLFQGLLIHLDLSNPSDIAYAIDTSSATDRNVLDVVSNFVANEINTHGSRSKIGLVSFGSKAKVLSPLTKDKVRLHDALIKMVPIGGERRIDVMLRLIKDDIFPSSLFYLNKDRTRHLIMFITGKNSYTGDDSF